MIAVTAAMVVPSLDLTGASIEDESKRLQSTLRFAMEEAQLSAEPLRWVATKHGWYFEVLMQDNVQQGQDLLPLSQGSQYIEPSYTWEAYEDKPLQTYNLPAPLFIQTVEQVIEFNLGIEVKSMGSGEDKEPILGKIIFLPDGTTSLSDIVLASEQEDIAPVVLRVRPGPAGIRLKKKDKN